MSWTALIPSSLFACTLVAWWFTEPKTFRVNLIAVTGCLLFIWAVAPDLSRESKANAHSPAMALTALLRVDALVMNHADKLFTAGAVLWLLRRSWQTLWKPVPELIGILGVDVPDAPDLSLAGIRADAAVLNWSRAPANKPVEKFLIQVNGVVVGDVPANQEPAIQAMGLKPNHFYNVRVVAVGANNFQAGSRVIRLRTFGEDGRPELGNARLPSNFHTDESAVQPAAGDHSEENGMPRRSTLSLETTTAPEVQSSLRDGTAITAAAARRNTLTRRHSPSTASQEPPQPRDDNAEEPEPSVAELTLRFDEVRREIGEHQSAIAKEDEYSKRQYDELDAEKRERRREQKQKEEQTDKLKREQGVTERAMRAAQQRRSNKEKQLKEKQNERVKTQDGVVNWKKGIDDMKREQETYHAMRLRLEAERNEKAERLRNDKQALQDDSVGLEGRLKDLRESVRELNDDRQRLPGGEEDAEWREQTAQLKKVWQHRLHEYQQHVEELKKVSRTRDAQIYNYSQHIQLIGQNAAEMHNYANSSAGDFAAASTPSQLKRRSRNSASLSSVAPSPMPGYAVPDPSAQPPPAPVSFSGSRLSGTGFAQAPYMDLGGLPPRMDEAGIRVQSVPLSPSAAALVPKSILDDDDPLGSSSILPSLSPLVPMASGSPEEDPQSPASSGRSLSIMSSPQGSSHHLPFPQFMAESSDMLSINTGVLPSGNVSAVHSAANRFGNLFSSKRSRGAKELENGGPALGTLKAGQSQSFPRQTDEQEALANKRRISLSSTLNMFNRNSAGPGTLESLAPGSRVFSPRSFLPFSSPGRAGSGSLVERDPSSPRPDSMASSEHLPRPSTDSGSIWGPPDSSAVASRVWMDRAPWSRSASRRPSVHGSPSVLKTTLAEAEDEILDQEDLSNPSQVGVIGSRPKTLAQRLNPTATPFMATVFRLKADKDKDKDKDKDVSKEKDKSKGKEKDKSKDKNKDSKDKAKTAAAAAAMAEDGHVRPSIEESPSDSRLSRDALSVHTQTSVSISESHESLPLDHTVSNTTSELGGGLAGGVKEQENVVRKLFRKGSSSKFSLPGRLGGNRDGASGGLFAKKGPSSIASASANSDRGPSAGVPADARSSMGDAPDDHSTAAAMALAVDDSMQPAQLGRGYDSAASSPALGPIASSSGSIKGAGGGRDGGGSGSIRSGTSRWFSIKKGRSHKEKESLEIEREKQPSELDGAMTPTEELSKA